MPSERQRLGGVFFVHGLPLLTTLIALAAGTRHTLFASRDPGPWVSAC